MSGSAEPMLGAIALLIGLLAILIFIAVVIGAIVWLFLGLGVGLISIGEALEAAYDMYCGEAIKQRTKDAIAVISNAIGSYGLLTTVALAGIAFANLFIAVLAKTHVRYAESVGSTSQLTAVVEGYNPDPWAFVIIMVPGFVGLALLAVSAYVGSESATDKFVFGGPMPEEVNQ